MFNIYKSSVLGKEFNVYYKTPVEVSDTASLLNAVSQDYVCAEYRNGRRSEENFISSNCLPVDCDNDMSDDPSTWLYPEKLKELFPNVTFAVHFSRNYMKDKVYTDKDGNVVKVVTARPRFHVFFEIATMTNAKDYAKLKKKLSDLFPFFDSNALDASRFFFGTEAPEGFFVQGTKPLNDFIEEYEFAHAFDNIKEGERNKAMSVIAAKIIKKHGDTEKAKDLFLEKSSLCIPPLDDEELNTIWNSARKFFKKISADPNYIPPEKYNDPNSYKPNDFTDVGQATVLAKYFKPLLRYSPATHFICFKENYWEESDIAAQAFVHELTRRQLLEAEREMAEARIEMATNGAQQLLDYNSTSKALSLMDEKQADAYDKYMAALAYRKFVLGRRESKYITACLKEVKPMVEIKPSELDRDPFLICTPNGTYDLRLGVDKVMPNEPSNYISKMTACGPSEKGKEIWLECLNKIFSKNPELIDYVQMLCGLAAIGKVQVEAMIIAYGDGGNGKSTFWNAVFRTLGLYSGKISADTLTTQCRRNTKPELAEAKGKRLLIASESQQGARLDESMVKQLCSTDEVQAEKKYKDPFHYTPCHTLVLYTNYLPRVSGIDDGIWNRLLVVPFNNKLRGGSDDIKNYADFLYENAGEYIMKWIIEGAKKVIDLKYHIPEPQTVTDAISEYREQNNWFNHFINDCCEVDKKAYVSSNELYSAYRKYCQENNEFVRSTTEFYGTLDKNGYHRGTEKRVRVIYGLRLIVDEIQAFSDFLK